MSKKLLLAEFIALFILLPLFIAVFKLHKFFLLFLWVFGYLCYRKLSVDKKELRNRGAVNMKNLKPIIIRLIIASALLLTYVYYFEHARMFGLIRDRPIMWVVIMILYPLLSVYPQEIIYRAYFFDRYKGLFSSDEKLLLGSAFAFGFAHIIFQNFIAVSLCAVGGYIFGTTYREKRSLLLVCVEHALYGCMIFTLGLGWYFYHGTIGIR